MTDFNDFDRTLQRRRQMTEKFETALREAPVEMEELLKSVGEAYHSGRIPRFWDVLAALAGCDRGYGNSWFYTALELKKQAEEEKDE